MLELLLPLPERRVRVLPGLSFVPLGKVNFCGPLSRIVYPVSVNVFFPVFFTWMYSLV